MRFIPVDSARVMLLFAGSVMPKAKYQDGQRVAGAQDTDDKGVPLWVVDCMVPGEDGQRAEVVGVTVPMPYQPVLSPLSPVTFEGLAVQVYVRKGTTQVAQSFVAEAIAKECLS